MSRSLRIYLIVLAVANGLIAWGGISLTMALRAAYAELLDNRGLPTITHVALRLPGVFALLAFVSLLIPLAARWSPSFTARVVHAVAFVVALDLGLLILGLLGLIMPFFSLTWTLDVGG